LNPYFTIVFGRVLLRGSDWSRVATRGLVGLLAFRRSDDYYSNTTELITIVRSYNLVQAVSGYQTSKSPIIAFSAEHL
jgi:hypothetical protein